MELNAKTMAANQRKSFDANYHDALKAHLNGKRTGRLTSRSARKMGKEATALGLSEVDLARTHDQAMRLLEPIEAAEEMGVPSLSPAAIFFIEALVPLVQVRKAEQTNAQQTQRALVRKLQQENQRHDKLLAESQRQKEQVRQLTRQFFLAQEKERKEISRDLHDEIAQVLAGINVRLAALKKIAQRETRDIGERIDETQKLVEQSVAAVHRYALRLRPSLLDDLGLVPSLRSYIRNLPGCKDLSIRFKANKDVDFLSNEQCTALYRVAQEALTNVVRHSHAKNVSVSLRKLSNRICLQVRDDGKAFDAKRILNSKSYACLGLLGMRERVEMMSGTFSIVSTPAKGTTVNAEIPMGFAPSKDQP